MEEDKLTEIEKANRLLFERIAKLESGRQSSLECHNPKGEALANSKLKISRKLKKIGKSNLFNENLKLLERLRKSKPSVNVRQLENAESERQRLISNIQEFKGPVKFSRSPSHSKAPLPPRTKLRRYESQSRKEGEMELGGAF